MKKPMLGAFLSCFFFLVAGCSSPKPQQTLRGAKPDAASSEAANPLLGRIWRVPESPYGAAAGSIYVFLPNGTLLETSCVETYRVATWTPDKTDSRTVHVVEDQRPAFDATVVQSSVGSIQLKQTLAMGNRETRELTLAAVDREFVCPDLKK